MVTTDDYSYKPGLAAGAPPPPPPPPADPAPSFQQHHHHPLQLHGAGDHDKVLLPASPQLFSYHSMH